MASAVSIFPLAIQITFIRMRPKSAAVARKV